MNFGFVTSDEMKQSNNRLKSGYHKLVHVISIRSLVL